MHPEIVQDGPGTCPICGMALEPKGVPAADAGPNPELVDFTRRLKIGAALALPLLVLAMGPDARPARCTAGSRRRPPAGSSWCWRRRWSLWCGRPFFERGWASIVNRSPNMWTLISIGVLAAYAYSVVAVLAPGLFPHDFHMHGGGVGRYFEAAAVIVVLVLLGQVLELRARETHRRRDPRAARPRAEDRAARSPPMAARPTCRSRPSRSATGCACARARPFRSTAWCSRASRRSTNRC